MSELAPEFGSAIEDPQPEVEVAKRHLTLGDRAETGIFQCCGSKCSCATR